MTDMTDMTDMSDMTDMTVAFPNRKSYFFDNKLEFSDIKIAIGQGFR